jgi:hypothetical protein
MQEIKFQSSTWYLVLHQQIIPLPMKLTMLFALKYEDYISRHSARCLICLSSKYNFLLVLHSFVNWYLQYLAKSGSDSNTLHPSAECKKSTFFSWTTFFPPHCVQRSLAFMTAPDPSHWGHRTCICWIIPGPIWRVTSLIPPPSHESQVVFALGFLLQYEIKCKKEKTRQCPQIENWTEAS